jgi:hypothetical protein
VIERHEIVDRLVAAVREVAAEKPDFVYDAPYGGCVYVADKQPSCIVGQAAWRLGLIDATFEKDDGINMSGVTTFLRELGADLGDDETLYGREFLDTVQVKQDEGVPWGDAVEIADERAETWTA